MTTHSIGSSHTATRFNLLVAAIFCLALAALPLTALAPGSSWLERFTSIPGTLWDALQRSTLSTISTVILPLAAGALCIAGFFLHLTREGGQARQRIVYAVAVATLLLVLAAAVLLQGVPLIAVALLPLGIAVYVARREQMP